MHKFQVGQSVDLIPSIVRRAAKGTYEIIRLIPDNDDDPAGHAAHTLLG